ncbi:uncharacterized protein LOC107810320 isoform X6 [Nicotiana tabacum]|uniref:Uncharacterized protein LOC107810320 isoform X6 n=3 Tax=Nicotiana TaxID=4085 RepID=A0AC58UVD9_TOBAC|nr:PREDICTED: uncharacterized protein LOC104234714 isoform X3 [Nicotiana sylvestris]XP_016490568.1 PREDICTED: uncharacterized protein LOC107810320 isoform X2 [Nicotiana tabacum]
MEVELEPRVKPLPFKVKGMSRESPSQKASHVLDPDLRNHWSTGTNTKEWILLELDEPCLLSHIRIYNKSVLEWEISAGLRYKPETFPKVRPRCEAPRRDMMYPMNYTPCHYVRISCLRGSPIAIFFVQLIGITVTGLEPEFQPIFNYLLPHIISSKQDDNDMHLQLLQDITNRLGVFLPQLEADLNSFSEASEYATRFLAMLAGPLYPILRIVKEREMARSVGSISESEALRNSQSAIALTVSSNFEPRRSRNMSSLNFPTSCYLAFRPDAIFILLRKAYKDSNLGNICRVASGILLKFLDPIKAPEASLSCSEITTSVPDEGSQSEPCTPASFADYSDLFGDEFQIPEYQWDSKFTNVLDIGLVEEGILHVLYACVSQPLLCSKLAENTSDFWLALPLVQALLPALRPSINSSDPIDEDLSLWKQPFVQKALSQIVGTSSSSVYRPLLRACAGYLSSFSPSNGRAACVLIDLCSGVLAPWMPQVIAKIDLALDLLEDLLPVIQCARHSFARARAALKYIVLALSGVMDDILVKYKDAKHQMLFLVEMLEPYLDPAITPVQSIIAFGNVSSVFLEKQEKNCAIALNVIRIAVQKSAVLPSLEAEWRRRSVAPSVLLSVLEPHMQLPSDVDLRQSPSAELLGPQLLNVSPCSGGASSRSGGHDDSDAKVDSDMTAQADMPEEVSLLFAPPELNRISLVSGSLEKKCTDLSSDVKKEVNHIDEQATNNQFDNGALSASDYTVEYSNLHADYFQLVSYRDCQMKASEFRRLAMDLHSQCEITPEGHDAAIDALLLAAECYVNPFFMMSSRDSSSIMNKLSTKKPSKNHEVSVLRNLFEEDNDFKIVADLERKRDKFVLEIILEAAELDRKYQQNLDGEYPTPYVEGNDEKLELSQQDIKSADAITLLRQNQALLCDFLIHCLQKEEHPTHEILLQILLFLLHSGTRLNCPPELVVDTIIKSAEHLNQQLRSFYYQLKEGTGQLNEQKLQAVRRRWILLQRLIIASSGCDEVSELSINYRSGFRFANLVPASAWLQKIPAFSSSTSPLARFLGWMAISRNAKQYQKERLFLISDLPQLTYLLSIFSDELAVIGYLEKKDDKKIEESGSNSNSRKGAESCSPQSGDQSFSVIYPDIRQFFPSLQKDFEVFGESILEAVALQLRSLSPAIVPDLLCWFSDFCLWPFVQEENQFSCRKSSGFAKGFVAKNAKAIVFYVLEAIVAEHMEAVVPEVPTLMQVLVSLCRSSYCDVSFLRSVLQLLKPIISYSLGKCAANENLVSDDSCLNLEALCFDELFDIIKDENHSTPREDGLCRAMPIFVLASVFPDLSFRRKVELLQSSISCADFASCGPTTSFHDYLCAYQALVGNCRVLLLETLRAWGVIPCTISQLSETDISAPCDDRSEQYSTFLSDICCCSTEMNETNMDDNAVVNKKSQLKAVEVGMVLKDLEALISKLNSNIERCFRIHHKLAKSLALVSAESFVYSRCLTLVAEKVPVSEGSEEGILLKTESISDFTYCWKISLEGLAETILVLQENHLWELASVILGSVLAVPQHFSLDSVIGNVCSAVKNFLHGAPSITWRLHSDQWISMLFERGIHSYHECQGSLIDLFSFMLCHPEPEQRFIALKHLGKLISQDGHSGSALLCSSIRDKVTLSVSESSACEPIISAIVSGSWDQVALLASSDPSQRLRIHAMALLVNYVPFSERRNLQSFLAAADTVLQCLTKLSQPTCEGPLAQLSMLLFASACLYSPVEDISLIPENIWSSVESFALGGNERVPVSLEKRICQALCRLRNEGDEAKEMLKEALSSNSQQQIDPDFGHTRETILQVIADLSAVNSYFDFFSKECDQKELEEAEIEMELLQKEKAMQELSAEFKDLHQLPFLTDSARQDNRLQQIKEEIKSLEKAKLKEEVVARRQRKLLSRHARQKFLEEATLREAELLQELDRERIAEVEKEIERQRVLDLERAKTRELRLSLDLEKERQTQRELQRELEQVESGVRPSRREFSSTHSSRPRERYRERENGRAGNEGTKTSTGITQPETATSSSMVTMPTVVLSGARQFSGQLPTILQSRDRSDECGSSYEENFDGSKDSGDTGSIGDADLVSALEGPSMGFGSSQRHGIRGSKSRQIVERRERDGRREGKWERKH